MRYFRENRKKGIVLHSEIGKLWRIEDILDIDGALKTALEEEPKYLLDAEHEAKNGGSCWPAMFRVIPGDVDMKDPFVSTKEEAFFAYITHAESVLNERTQEEWIFFQGESSFGNFLGYVIPTQENGRGGMREGGLVYTQDRLNQRFIDRCLNESRP